MLFCYVDISLSVYFAFSFYFTIFVILLDCVSFVISIFRVQFDILCYFAISILRCYLHILQLFRSSISLCRCYLYIVVISLFRSSAMLFFRHFAIYIFCFFPWSNQNSYTCVKILGPRQGVLPANKNICIFIFIYVCEYIYIYICIYIYIYILLVKNQAMDRRYG